MSSPDLVPDELGRGYDVMLDLKRTLDPHNIMNPGKIFPEDSPLLEAEEPIVLPVGEPTRVTVDPG